VLLDAGNFTGRNPGTDEARGMFIFEMMKLSGYDGATIGVSDMQLGRDVLAALARESPFPIVSANLCDAESGKPIFAPYAFIERGGIRVGITGIAVSREFTESVCAEHSLRVLDPFDALADVIPRLRREAEVVVLMASTALSDARQLGEHFFGQIDVVIVGGGFTNRGLVFPENGRALYICSANRGQALGLAKLALADGRVDKQTGEEIFLDKQTEPDPQIEAIVNDFAMNLAQLTKVSIAEHLITTVSEDGHFYVGAVQCGECHRREYEIWLASAHNQAFATLVAAGKQNSRDCLPCHATGVGDPTGYDAAEEVLRKFVAVQCEACHGKGTRHARDGSYELTLREDLCVGCHDAENSPGFDRDAYWEKIAH
jgi:2',3'-cyclic-nucleotide 2'-phosphodiesterase (5'-nucleotidase family)